MVGLVWAYRSVLPMLLAYFIKYYYYIIVSILASINN